MNEEQKKHYEQLKKDSQKNIKKKKWKENVLLQESLAALGTEKEVLSISAQEKVLEEVNRKIKILMQVNDVKKRIISSVEEINDDLNGCNVYIVWDEADLPIIKTKFINIKNNIDDVMAVSFDTWIVTEKFDRFIEFDHNNKITEFF